MSHDQSKHNPYIKATIIIPFFNQYIEEVIVKKLLNNGIVKKDFFFFLVEMYVKEFKDNN